MKPDRGVGYFGKCDHCRMPIESEPFGETVYFATERNPNYDRDRTGREPYHLRYHRSCARKVQQKRQEERQQDAVASSRPR